MAFFLFFSGDKQEIEVALPKTPPKGDTTSSVQQKSDQNMACNYNEWLLKGNERKSVLCCGHHLHLLIKNVLTKKDRSYLKYCFTRLGLIVKPRFTYPSFV